MKGKIKRWNGQFKNAPKGRMIFKYDQDDILEILTEHLAETNGYGTFASTARFIGTPDEDIRLICVVSDMDDLDIYKLDLEELDRSIDFNGSHAHAIWLSKQE